MHQIASKFTLLESRLSSQTTLNDRVARLESKISNHADLHNRHSELHSHTSSRINLLEAQNQPDPSHDHLVARINSKLDLLDASQRTPQPHLGADANADKVNALQDRIGRLNSLRAKYEREERELMK
jgi:DNA repair ATPase RecN